ncbi:MAG: ExeM/NucH family extracellular endonuclease [Actinomycetaceae bacterium]|nr:ExeM/NucH family extracellular endonuclease [Actinomycetaceae bacterium]
MRLSRTSKPATVLAAMMAASLAGGALPAMADTETPPAAAETTITSIAQIQGEGETSPVVDQTVTTTGVITAVLEGRGGFAMQMKTAEVPADFNGSSGVFVKASTAGLDLGMEVTVSGQVAEVDGLTTINATAVEVVAKDQGATVVVEERAFPRGEEARSYESMLIQPAGTYRVNGNAELAYNGQITLNDGERPLLQATQAGLPGSPEAKEQAAYNDAHMLTLDDGSNQRFDVKFFEKFDPQPPMELPFLVDGQPGPTLGAEVTFHAPVLVNYVDKSWVMDPVRTLPAQDLISFSAVREDAPAQLGGNFTVATFNVLNFFTSLGVDATDVDKEGNPLCQPTMNLYDNTEPVSGNWDCPRRGAWDKAGLHRQEVKIANAINKLGDAGAQVVALQEIENAIKFGPDYDAALKYLVEVLNSSDPSQGWEYAPAPAAMPTYGNDDVIRQAFIYKPAAVKLAGESVFLDDPAFVSAADARAPIAQSFTHLESGKTVLVINNHLTYKGGKVVGDDNANPGDTLGAAWDTGRNNGDRTRQAQALAKFAPQQAATDGAQMTLLVGDMNAYAYETPIQTLVEAGYADLMNTNEFPSAHSATPWDEYTYSYRSTFGSLDHVMVSDAGMEWYVGHDVWTANAYEPQVYEYSRYRFTGVPYYREDVFRASDHNAVIVAFQLPVEGIEPAPVDPAPVDPAPTVPAKPAPTADPTPAPPVSATGGKLAVTGSSAMVFVPLAALLAAAGGALVVWRRQRI